MEFYERMIKAIDYIESHLDDIIDYTELAKIVYCNAYQFGRIFSYVTGMPLSEYIRNRKLSLAAIDLQSGSLKVIDVAFKYGYNSSESFSRAFREVHGITPKQACSLGVSIKLYPRIFFQISIKGDLNMDYRIEKKDIIKGVGVTKIFCQKTTSTESGNWKDQMGERWAFWDSFLYEGGTNSIINDKYKLYRAPFWQMGVTHTLENGNILECIGAEDRGDSYPELEHFEIPASTWAVFTAKGSLSKDIHPIDALTTRIFSEWFPSSGYEKSMDYEIQVYGPGDTSSDDYTCELWIPIKNK